LHIAGDGPDRQKLENWAHDHLVPDVTFYGHVTDSQKLRLLREADLFCSPALYGESFGIVLLEAMASGTVIVAGNNDGYGTVMQDRGRVSLVDPQDKDEFAQRLDLLLRDQALRTEWRAWANEYVQQFDYRKVVDRYETVYQNVLTEARVG
jgi:phosphatidylinositol alpha-mannosyltransferase